MERHSVILRAGDPWDDGHGRVRSICVVSNLTGEELRSAVSRSDYDMTFCKDYQDRILPDAKYEELLARVTNPNDRQYLTTHWVFTHKGSHYDGGYALDDTAYHRVWLIVARLGNPDLFIHEYEAKQDVVDIGGYGLLG